MSTHTFRFAGFGGQGVLLMGMTICYAGMKENKNVTWLPSYGAEMRGGTANCTVVVSTEEIAAPVVQNPDYLIAMNEPSLAKFAPTVRPGGTIFINSSLITSKIPRQDVEVIKIDATNLANELGNPRVANMVMLGAVIKRSQVVEIAMIKKHLLDVMGHNKADLEAINHQALDKGSALVKS
ncbi:MAG TPA: 2-oxoacid:ferredoxin oxidoreductase subunit gamma [Candidatus Wirthbacteria bacterium]|nr:2-oxoacid:ferredoxin oxidoreductase subunit gamma [Candidatus Wirthbacteria bacterium]